MSLAIVLGGWTAASILLSPLIGRFLSAQDEPKTRGDLHPRARSSTWIRPRPGADLSLRRNVAIQADRREAGWPRAG